jgi:ubiquinone/menaquinone biosynthesis C-methylase UbiE
VTESVHRRELEHHEALYSGFGQQHFAKPAVRMLRAHIVSRILFHTEAGPASRVLSLGCGIGDTELLLAPYVREIVGVDLSPAAIRQAREDAARANAPNVRFLEGAFERMPPGEEPFDAAVAIFFLHHVPEIPPVARRIYESLRPGGVLYALDPSRYRLSGALGRVLVPRLMKRYRTPDERELRPGELRRVFAAAGFDARTEMYDFASSPLAGLLPSSSRTYFAARFLDDWILRAPGLRALGSNFQLIARKPR